MNDEFRVSRRTAIAIAGTSLLSLSIERKYFGKAHQDPTGRLRARPRANVKTSITGSRALGLDAVRDVLLQVPADTSKPVPLMIALHGAGQSAAWMQSVIGKLADEAGVALLIPNSRASSWDAIRGDFGVDVEFIDRALEKTYSLVAVDPLRVAIGGFSDGATYALSLGLINGDACRKIVAFSPGFVVEGAPAGKPEFFISHGTADRVLPIDQCSRRIVPVLKGRGYTVTYREFEGPHTVPEDIAREALGWVRG